jgi:hypothetical protein
MDPTQPTNNNNSANHQRNTVFTTLRGDPSRSDQFTILLVLELGKTYEDRRIARSFN